MRIWEKYKYPRTLKKKKKKTFFIVIKYKKYFLRLNLISDFLKIWTFIVSNYWLTPKSTAHVVA